MGRAFCSERGWAGHFIGSFNCMFRRNTLLELGDRGVVVSTVGSWKPGGEESDEFAEVRPGVYYETCAFFAQPGPYRDADVRQQIFFDAPWGISELGDDDGADINHDAVVAELSMKLEGGVEL